MAFYAAFYKGSRPGLQGLYNRLVIWWDNGPYSHCELIFSDGSAASASFIDGGIRFKQIDFNADRWDFLPLDKNMESQARAWFVDHNGDSYDLFGNIRFAIDCLPDDKQKWFCSEAVGASLGVIDPWRFGPNSLAAVLHSLR